MSLIELRNYDNSWYHPGGSLLRRALWLLIGEPLVASWLPGSGPRVRVLRAFGARIGRGVVVKPGVKVKYPWHLEVGDQVWLGEKCWIDNLTKVRIGSNSCISQGAYLCTGNHDWSDPQFGLRIEPIQMGEGSWAGAKSVLTPGTVLGSYAVVAAGSVVKGYVPEFQIYAGNPAQFVKVRRIRAARAVEPEVVRS